MKIQMPEIIFRDIKKALVLLKKIKCYNVILENYTAVAVIGSITADIA